MYRIAIPVTNRYSNRRMDCEAVLSELRRAGATRVWLCTARGIEREECLSEELTLLIDGNPRVLPNFDHSLLEAHTRIMGPVMARIMQALHENIQH